MIQPADKDNEFDDLIREAGDKYHPTGANPDWDHMQTLLDIHMPVGKGPRRRGFYLFILLFLLSGASYLFFNIARQKASIPGKDQQATIDPADKAAPPPAANPVAEAKKSNDGQLQQEQLLQNKEKTSTKNKSGTARHTNLQNKPGRIKVKSVNGGIAENKSLPVTGVEAASNDENESMTTPGNLPKGISAQQLSTVNDVNNKLTDKTISPGIMSTENKIPADKNIAAAKKKNKNNEKGKQPFEFSIVYAPELTTVGFYHIDKPGSNYGVLVGYQISKNLVIQTGFIKSKKNYIADGEDFVLDYNPSSSHKLNEVDGYCMMYEIPLNIKSQISKGKKLNLFYTAGISSYFMKSEFYTYNFATANGSYDKDVQYNTQRNYWFSLATAGFGVEKEITNTLNISAMPFIKIPFKGMGEGELKLLGTGINFVLTYKPFFQKK